MLVLGLSFVELLDKLFKVLVIADIFFHGEYLDSESALVFIYNSLCNIFVTEYLSLDFLR